MAKKKTDDQPAVPVVESAVETAVDVVATEPAVVPVSKATATVSEETSPLFRVTHGDFSQEIHADDENEARALFNDFRKVWPSPREVAVERL